MTKTEMIQQFNVQREALVAILASAKDDRYVVRHGGVLGLYVERIDGGVLVTTLECVKTYQKPIAKYIAKAVCNGSDAYGVAVEYKQALQDEIEKYDTLIKALA